MMTHDEITADLSLYVLGTLDPLEQRQIEQHLATGCRECQRELAQWREVVDFLPLAAEETPPPDLKSALLQRVATGPSPAKVVRLPRWVTIPLAAAAGAVIALGVVRQGRMRAELGRQQQVVASLNQELASAKGDLQRLTQVLATKETDITSLRTALAAAQDSLAVVQAPGLHLVRLKETPQGQPAEGHVLMSRDTRRALFYAFDLPAVPPDKAYELWWITEKEGPINAGVFRPDPRGLGRVEASVPTNAGAIQAAAVTIEPAGGLPKPTGPMVLVGTVS